MTDADDSWRLGLDAMAQAGIPYAAVGPIEKLEDPRSRDIDVFVDDADLDAITSIVGRVYADSGWTLVARVENDYSRQLYFANAVGEAEPRFIQLDLMPGASWRGFEYFRGKDAARMARLERGIRVLEAGVTRLYKWFRIAVWNPSAAGPPDFRQGAGDAEAMKELSLWVGHDLASSISSPGDDGLERFPAMQLRKGVVRSTLERQGLGALGRVLNHFWLLSRRFMRPSGVLVVGSEELRITGSELKARVEGGAPFPFIVYADFTGRVEASGRMSFGTGCALWGCLARGGLVYMEEPAYRLRVRPWMKWMIRNHTLGTDPDPGREAGGRDFYRYLIDWMNARLHGNCIGSSD